MDPDVDIEIAARRKPTGPVAMPTPRTPPWRRQWRIEPAGPVANATALYGACGEGLARLLLELASWDRQSGGCPVSDTSFLVVSFQPAPQVGPYVQFLSAPTHETVLWEVASLDYMPNLAHLLSHAKHAALTRRGFAKGRLSPANYAREVVIGDLDASRRVARETLEILVEIFDYRGHQPLHLFYVGERSARPGLVHTRLRLTELAFLLRRAGLGVHSDQSTIRVTHPTGHEVRLAPSRGATPDGFDEYAATARLAPHPRLTDRFAHEWNAGAVLGRLHLEPGGDGVLRLVLPLRHGMSESHLAGVVTDLLWEVASLATALRGQAREGPLMRPGQAQAVRITRPKPAADDDTSG